MGEVLPSLGTGKAERSRGSAEPDEISQFLLGSNFSSLRENQEKKEEYGQDTVHYEREKKDDGGTGRRDIWS